MTTSERGVRQETDRGEIPVGGENREKRLSGRQAARRFFLKLCGAALTAGVAAPVHAHFIEPYALDLTDHEVFLPDLPAACDGLRIAHLTDLHRGAPTPDIVLRQAITRAAAARPDLVVVTGDFVEHFASDARAVAGMLGELTPRYGIWGCLGNHDYREDADAVTADLEKHSALRMLRNGSAEIVPNLHLAAIEDTERGRPDGDAALADVPDGSALIFLTHNPKGVFHVTDRSCLALAGHTHGGQVVVPGFPPPTPSGMEGFPLIAGWGTFDRAQLYVSRGIGMSSLPIRFNCRPEVALVTLRRGDGPPKTGSDLTGRATRKVARVARKLWRKVGGHGA
ncbi:MAG: metallophosphoesterase [Capsulimonadales bacterium]|nr:metallophosphoesterase [Capsulimonadales bacterium]